MNCRVIISEQAGTTAYFTFSSQMRPDIHEFRIYGNKNGLIVDQDTETLIKLRGDGYKSYLQMFAPPVIMARQHLGNLKVNLGKFLARDFHMKSGMKYLIEAFYRSIVEDTPVPIPYREILLTAKIMDAIFAQLAAKQSQILARSPGDFAYGSAELRLWFMWQAFRASFTSIRVDKVFETADRDDSLAEEQYR